LSVLCPRPRTARRACKAVKTPFSASLSPKDPIVLTFCSHRMLLSPNEPILYCIIQNLLIKVQVDPLISLINLCWLFRAHPYDFLLFNCLSRKNTISSYSNAHWGRKCPWSTPLSFRYRAYIILNNTKSSD
jgi:hypothetical protein